MNVSSIGSEIIHSNSPQNDILKKDDFLTLLITQLSNQNPMKPMDNNELITQMTAFSSLEELGNIRDGVENTTMLTQSLNSAFSTTMIGKQVVVQGDTLEINDGHVTEFGFYAPSSGNAEVKITNDMGEVVRELSVEVDKDGFMQVEWDLNDTNGDSVLDGSYSFSVNFTNEDGIEAQLSSYLQGRVGSIKFEGGNTYLEIDDRRFSLGQVVEVLE
ncbi:hypothetical protein J7M07_08365 [bacterium]|nr:hypothetical protein [bacterium]